MDYTKPEDDNTDYRKTNFPARHIYERLLPEVVERLSDVFYHRGSPYSGFGKDTRDRYHGDIHQCKCALSIQREEPKGKPMNSLTVS